MTPVLRANAGQKARASMSIPHSPTKETCSSYTLLHHNQVFNTIYKFNKQTKTTIQAFIPSKFGRLEIKTQQEPHEQKKRIVLFFK